MIIILYFELLYFENAFATSCMKFSIMENNPNQAFICLEINFNRFLNDINFNYPDNFDFGIMYYDNFYLIPILYGRKNIYEDIKDVFNDSVSKRYIIDDNKMFHFDLFHFLYYNLTKVAKENPELKVNFTEIEEEYNITQNKIIKELLEYNKTREVDKIVITFTKLFAEKNLLVIIINVLKTIML